MMRRILVITAILLILVPGSACSPRATPASLTPTHPLPTTDRAVSPVSSPTTSPPLAFSDAQSPESQTPIPSDPEMIFTTQEPQNLSQRWGVPYELGTLFFATVEGSITAVRVYGAQTESGLHTVRIWHWDSATMVAGPYEWDFAGPGWHEFTLPTPVSIQAHTDYIVSVSTGTDPAYDFVSTIGGFDEPILRSHLVTYQDSGLGTQTMGNMPTWLIPESRSFFRDVVFVPGIVETPTPSPPLARTDETNATYYVATDGNDAWSGTLPEPNAQETDGPWRSIQHAAGSLQPGDTVYVRGGTYYEWVWLNSSDSGTESAPKTFAAYPGEEVVLNGAVYPTEWQPYSGNIWWTDASAIDFNWEGQARLVWQDDVWLEHSSSLGTMTEGTWWFDVSTERLYVWSRGGGDPGQHEIAVSSLRNAFHLDVASWIVLDGFHIAHYYRGISQMDSIADRSLNMEGLTVRNCVIEHVGEGIGLAGATFGTWGFTHRSRIENNVIRDTQSDAMWIGSGTNHVIRGNTISDVKQAWYRGFVSAAIIVGNADNSIVEQNLVYDVHALGIDVEHFYNGGYGNSNVVRRNMVYDVGGHAIAILGANDTRVENNIIHDVQIFGVLVNTEAGPALGNQIINNTIYDVSDRGIAVIEGSPGQSGGLLPQDTVVQNNIFSNISNWSIFNEGENTSADYDLYWQTQGGVAYWEGTTYFTLADLQSIGQETHGVADDPLFVSPGGDFRLNAMSPAIDAGSNENAPALDYWGTPRPWDGDGDSIAVVDIGAHEFVPALTLSGAPADQTIYLSWVLNINLPVTSTWQIDYRGPAGDQPSPINDIPNATRSYTLTGLTNYIWYTVTLNAMRGSVAFLADSVVVMPTNYFVYLPIILGHRSS